MPIGNRRYSRLETRATINRSNTCGCSRASFRECYQWFLLVIFLFGLAAQLQARQPADEEGRIGFCAVDIFVDSGSSPLAAYQIKFAVTNGSAKIVGIEGGEHPAFKQPPFYDPKAIQGEVAIIASFNTAPGAELPTGKTRVATIHLQTVGNVAPQCEVNLQTAANSQGTKISLTVSLEKRKSND